MDTKDDPKALSTKEVIARETAQLLEQQNRISASKFEKGLAAAAKLSEEARLREAASSPEKHVLLKKLRDALEPLKGHVAGRNKDDVEEAIAMVEALAVQLTQREGQLIQEKEEVKKLANFLKQASEDAKKLVDGERAFARAEIEDARAAVQRVEEALQEHERMSQASGKQDMDTPPGFFSPVIPKLEPFDASQQLLRDPPGDELNYRDMDTRRSFSSPVNPKKRRKSMTILNLLAEMDPRERVRRIRMIYNSLLASVKESWSKGAGSNLIASRLMGNFKCWRGARIIGEFPGVSVGDVFMNRIELCVVGLHHTTQDCMDYVPASMSPIGIPIATSVVISDDVADGVEIIYTGHRHVADQNLESGNLALETNMQNKITVRVIRGKKYMGSLSDKVYVYDGLYTVVKSWFKKEESGFGVYKCKLRRMEGQEATGIKSWWDTTCDFVFSGDISKGRENVAVRLFNNRDKNRDPLDFEYLARTNIPRIVKGTGCACLYACSDGCSCAEKNGGKFPYNLEGLLVRGKPLIYECGPFCSCPPRCRNRVTQKGLKNRLEVFRTQQSEETDWGVRSLDLIQAGAFICEYVGVVLTRNQAQVAGTNGDQLTDPSRFSNKWAEWGDFSLIDEEFVRPSYPPMPPLHFYLDLSSTRNVAGWIRHGASPNLFIQFVVYDHNNLMFPRLMLFAMENIPPMRELSFEV